MVSWYCKLLKLDFIILFESKINFKIEDMNQSFSRFSFFLVLDTQNISKL